MIRDWRTWLAIGALAAGVFICYVLPAFAADRVTYEAPAPFVRVNMIAIEATMTTLGYRVDGYSALYAPRVIFVDALPDGSWGEYVPATTCDVRRLPCTVEGAKIKLSERQPGACMVITLAHELGHDAAVRMGLIDGVPNQEVKTTLERISARVENNFGSFEYRPNCLLRR